MPTRFNRRLPERRHVYSVGRIVDAAGTMLACHIIDASEHGFRIEIGPGQPLPRTGWLKLDGNRWIVEQTWRNGAQAGLRVVTETEEAIPTQAPGVTSPRVRIADLRR